MTDEYNHHVLAKTASDKVLELWRNSEWSNEVVSEEVITIQNRSSFPSPDATFFDEFVDYSGVDIPGKGLKLFLVRYFFNT